MTAYRNFTPRGPTPQSEPIPDSGQVQNSAGGYTWEITDWQKLDRFLILGTEGGTYYISEKNLTKKNAEAVIRCIKEDGVRTVSRISEISDSGRAAKNDPALFALALCFAYGSDYTKMAAKLALPKVARIGTHLFHFAQFAEQFRGWGRSLKSAIEGWYSDQRDLAYQLVKYQQRDGWSHADLLRLSHPKAVDNELFRWALRDHAKFKGYKIEEGKYRVIDGFEKIQTADEGQVANIIRDYRLPREAVPTQFLSKKEVWEALLETDMGYEALIRNLGNMSKVGLLEPFSDATKRVVARLGDGEALRKARTHPIKILVGLRQYSHGKGMRGSGAWDVVPQVVDALNGAFYEAFKNFEPSGKNTMLALDVSGSMSSQMMNIPLRYCEGTAVMAMVTARVEPNYMVVGFADKLKDLKITASDTLESASKKALENNFGGTDCALPILAALEKKMPVEVFAVYTDNETWAGKVHPSQALVDYRKQTGIPAKLAVVGMAANNFTIADPKDPGMIDFVGFDTETPAAIAEFSRM